MVAEKRPLIEEWPGGMNLNFFWNRTLLGMFSWKFAFVSFSKVSKIFLAPTFPESCRGPWKNFNLWFQDYWKRHFWGRKLNFFWFLLITPSKKLLQERKRGRRGWFMELKKWPKLNLWGSTILATFTCVTFVLLSHNLDLIMLKCEGSLT